MKLLLVDKIGIALSKVDEEMRGTSFILVTIQE